jgi:hypothetical protein
VIEIDELEPVALGELTRRGFVSSTTRATFGQGRIESVLVELERWNGDFVGGHRFLSAGY